MSRLHYDVNKDISTGAACMSCYDPIPSKSPGHPRDCAKCLQRQLSDKRACPQCGAAIHGKRGMRDHWRQQHAKETTHGEE